jgi:hypothetical protein
MWSRRSSSLLLFLFLFFLLLLVFTDGFFVDVIDLGEELFQLSRMRRFINPTRKFYLLIK